MNDYRMSAGGSDGLAAAAERAFAGWPARAAWFLAFALLTRFSVFGDPNYLDDEMLYFTIGRGMHEGLLPYVDLWDRKGPGLFLAYYLFTGFSGSVWAFQIAACLAAAGTALAIAAIAARFSSRLGAMLAGTVYLAALPLFAGGGGQAAVFYNLPMALAALALLQRRYLPAMALAGFAGTFKQTAYLEGLAFGLLALADLRHRGLAWPRLHTRGISLALAGAAPMLVFALGYALAGHFAEFWHAMVLTNLAKAYNPSGDAAHRLTVILLELAPLLIPAAIGCILSRISAPTGIERWFMPIWLVGAAAGFLAVPNLIDHYVLPLLLPLTIAAAPALGWRAPGPIYAWAVLLVALLAGPEFDFAARRHSRTEMARTVSDLRARDPAGRLLVFEGPVALYPALGQRPPSPLIFPLHLYYAPERDTSHLSTRGEVAGLLAWQPSVVVMFHGPQPGLANPETLAMVGAYVRQNCRLWFTRNLNDRYGPKLYDFYGGCADH